MNKMSRYERLYREALRIRKRHGPDPKKALEGEGVTLIPMNTSTRLLGMYKVILRNPFVFYNDSVDEAVQRMVFAHELGHHLFHRDFAKDEELVEYTLFHLTDERELEANIFCAHYLLEEEQVYQMARAGYSYPEMAKAFSVDVNLMIFKLNEMQRMGYDLGFKEAPDNTFFSKIDGRRTL